MIRPRPLVHGTLDVMILSVLAGGEQHGLGISRELERITRGAFVVKPGSLFPALHRLESAWCVQSRWGESANRRRAKFYKLTTRGSRRLRREMQQWREISHAIGLLVGL
ncbi:MAG: PadR family transcriptional regulator [Gemmatimonadaceae bacterium]